MDKVKAAIENALKELNTVTDAEFASRRVVALRPLTLAAKALELALDHTSTASERLAPKAATPKAETKAATTKK